MYDDTLKIFAGIDTDGVKSGMKDVKSLVDKGMSAVKSVTSAGASAISGVTKAVTASIAAAGSGVAAFGTYAATAGKTFEKSMSNVMATMGITKDTIQDGQNSYELLSATAKKMGETTKFSASEAGDALNYLALAGYDAKKACEALPAVLNLAQAGDMDLARTSDLATDAMSALGIEATNENLTHFGDVLAKTASSSNTSVAQLGEAMLVCGGQTRLAGMSLEQTATVLGILADNGIKSAEGGTALRNLLKNIYTPTSQASKAMEALGIQTSDADGNLRDVQDILLDTMSALEKLSEADKMTAMSDIFDVRTIAAASAALNNSSERYDELYAKIMDCNGAMEQMAETQNDNLEGDIYGLKSAFEAVGISVYEGMTLSLRKSVQLGTTYLRQLNDAFKKNGFDGLAEALGDKLGDAITKISAKIPDFINIGSDIIKSFMTGISNNSKKLAKSASEIVSSLANGVLDLFPMFISVGGQLISDFADGITEKLPVLAEKALNIAEWLYNGIVENLPKIINIALDLIEKFGNKILDNFDKIIYAGINIIKILADGIKKGIPKVLKVAKQVVKDFADALEKEIPALKPFAEILKFISDNFEMLASTAVEVWAAFKGYKIISYASKAIKVLSVNLSALGTVLAAHPVIATATAVLALLKAVSMMYESSGGMAHYLDFTNAASDEALRKMEVCTEELEANRDKLNDLGETAKDTADKEQAHLDKVQSLWKELDKLADSSGRVKEADKDRAEYILSELNDALGTEYTMVDGQIQKYAELEKSIDSVIEKKRAESMLNAYSGQYEEALSQQAETVQKERNAYSTRQEVKNAQEEIWNQAREIFKTQGYSDEALDYKADEWLNADKEKIAELISKKYNQEVLDELNNIKVSANGIDYGWRDYSTSLKDLYVSSSNAYNVARSDLENINEIISGYEKAEEAVIAENYDKVAEYLNYRENSETNWAELAKQSESEVTKEIQKNLSERKTAFELANKSYKENANSANKEILETARKDLQDYLLEVDKIGFSEKSGGMEDALKAVEEAQNTYDEHAEKLRKNVEGYTNSVVSYDRNALAENRVAYYEMAIKAEKSGSTNFLKAMSESEKIGFENYSLVKKMEKIYEDDKTQLAKLKEKYADTDSEAIKSWIEDLERKVYNEQSSLNDIYMRSGISALEVWGESFTSEDRISSYVSSFASHISSDMDSQKEIVYRNAKEIGLYTGAGLSDGLNESIENVTNTCQAAVNAVTSSFQKLFEIHSPSRLMRDEVGKWILPGIAVGIDDTVSDTAISMNDSINELVSQIDVPTADKIVTGFQDILSNIGINAVPQYSDVYVQAQKNSQNKESEKAEIVQNNSQNIPEVNIFIGDEEIKNFVVSTLTEANAISGGASF